MNTCKIILYNDDIKHFLQFAIKKRLETVPWWNMNVIHVHFWLYLSDDLVTPPEETDS